MYRRDDLKKILFLSKTICQQKPQISSTLFQNISKYLGRYLFHQIQQPIPKLQILNLHKLSNGKFLAKKTITKKQAIFAKLGLVGQTNSWRFRFILFHNWLSDLVSKIKKTINNVNHRLNTKKWLVYRLSRKTLLLTYMLWMLLWWWMYTYI